MGGKRQNIQYSLALDLTGRGESPLGGHQGTEPPVAKPDPESPALAEGATPLLRLNPDEPPWYGPVCPVVWEGRHREVPPYPDQFGIRHSDPVTTPATARQRLPGTNCPAQPDGVPPPPRYRYSPDAYE